MISIRPETLEEIKAVREMDSRAHTKAILDEYREIFIRCLSISKVLNK